MSTFWLAGMGGRGVKGGTVQPFLLRTTSQRIPDCALVFLVSLTGCREHKAEKCSLYSGEPSVQRLSEGLLTQEGRKR